MTTLNPQVLVADDWVEEKLRFLSGESALHSATWVVWRMAMKNSSLASVFLLAALSLLEEQMD